MGTPRAKNMLGLRFGMWLVIGRDGFICRSAAWICRCDCGTEKTISGERLRSGESTKCALHQGTHRHTAKGYKSPTYSSWSAMISRCTHKSNPAFDYYRSRGITVCKRWRKFENFLADMGERPEGKTLDRFPDNDAGYKPGNCRWSTRREQANNRITNMLFEWKGKTYTLADLCRASGVSKEILRTRLVRSKHPWTVDSAIAQGNERLWRGDKRLPK